MNNENSRPKWKKFEKFVESIQRDLTPQAEVQHNVFIKGKSGVNRQIDIAVKYNLGQFNLLVVIDTKDWKNPIDINDVGSFSDLVEDIGANKGAIVCNSGFTSGALNRAREKGIDLMRASDAESKDWPVYMAVPTLCDFRKIENYRFRINYSGPSPFKMPKTNPKYLQIFNKKGRLIDIISNLVAKAWNEGELPIDPGEYSNLTFIKEKPYFKIENNLFGPFDITLDIKVTKNQFLGEVPIEKGKGFQNEVTGSFITNSIKTTNIDVVDVEKNWLKIENENDLSVKPVFEICATDFYPLTKLK